MYIELRGVKTGSRICILTCVCLVEWNTEPQSGTVWAFSGGQNRFVISSMGMSIRIGARTITRKDINRFIQDRRSLSIQQCIKPSSISTFVFVLLAAFQHIYVSGLFLLYIYIYLKPYRYRSFLTLSDFVFQSFIAFGRSSSCIQCPHRADVCKSLMVG